MVSDLRRPTPVALLVLCAAALVLCVALLVLSIARGQRFFIGRPFSSQVGNGAAPHKAWMDTGMPRGRAGILNIRKRGMQLRNKLAADGPHCSGGRASAPAAAMLNHGYYWATLQTRRCYSMPPLQSSPPPPPPPSPPPPPPPPRLLTNPRFRLSSRRSMWTALHRSRPYS